MVIQLNPEDLEGAEDVPQGVYEIIVEIPCNSKMMKTQVEDFTLPKCGFTIDSIIHLDINFHQLQLTRGSSYIELPAWIVKKKAATNPKNGKDEECFK